MLHIGMHPDDEVYFVEKRARRGKYEHAGEDGRVLSRDALKGLPDRLFVELDVENIVARVVESMPVRRPCLEKCIGKFRCEYTKANGTYITRTTLRSRLLMMRGSTFASSSPSVRSLYWTRDRSLGAWRSCTFLRIGLRRVLGEG